MRLSKVVFLLSALFAVSQLYASEDMGAVEKRIRELAPSADTIAVSETPVDGILQVQINGDIVYATSDGKYLFQGRLIDLDTRADLTEEAKSVLRKKLLANVDPKQQITFAPPHPEYNLMVFTDVDCGYCRKFHSQINEYMDEGIAVHYMAFPRAGIGSHSYDKAVAVWCSKDRQDALTQAKLGNEPKPAQCKNPVADDYHLGVELGVTGTPALITPEGQLIPGYMPPKQLRQRLDQLAANAKGTSAAKGK